jgi:hypothetical protein
VCSTVIASEAKQSSFLSCCSLSFLPLHGLPRFARKDGLKPSQRFFDVIFDANSY